MNVIISSLLTAPPSEVYAFRTLTLYATIFHNHDCLIESLSSEEIDYYYKWLKHNYALDFVKDFILPNQASGIYINTNTYDKLTLNNLNHFIAIIKN